MVPSEGVLSAKRFLIVFLHVRRGRGSSHRHNKLDPTAERREFDYNFYTSDGDVAYWDIFIRCMRMAVLTAAVQGPFSLLGPD